MVVVLVIGIIMAIAVPQFQAARTKASEDACWENQRLVDTAKQHWMMQESKSPTDTPNWSDLVPKYLKRIPECPLSGTYTLGSCQEDVRCDVHPR